MLEVTNAQDQSETMRVVSESLSPDHLLRWAFNLYGTDLAIASAFGAEGVVVIDMAAAIFPNLRVFMLDTGYLFPETLELVGKVERRYGIRVERILPAVTPEQQAELYQPELWRRNPDLCCRIRKIEPLKRMLKELRAWVTAIRRDQTPARRDVAKIGWDPRFQLVKINPLADWSSARVWNYIRQHGLDYNPLHDHDYPSIGCTHCTRPVRIGEDPRAGRWSDSGKSECGLHGK